MPDPAGTTTMIFGAATDPGYRLAQLLRRDGRHVTGVIAPGAYAGQLESLGVTLREVDPLCRADVAAVLAEAGAPPSVVSIIGGSPQLNSEGNLNVINAAADAGVSRFLLITSIGCGDSSASVDPFVKAFIGKALKAKNWAERQLRTTAMAWTIIRAGGMTLRPGRGGPMLVESPHVVGYINRADLGDLLYQALNSARTIHRVLAAVDRGKAFDVRGEPVVPAEL